MCIILFSLHSSIVSIRYSRAVPQRSSSLTMSQQSASQNLGFLGAVWWGQWPHPLWLARGIILECPYFQPKGRDSICASLAFVILSKALRPLASAEKGRVEKDLLLLFWCFRFLCPGEREQPEIYNSPTMLGCEVGDAEREWCCSSKTCHPYISAVHAISVFVTSSQRTEVKGTHVLEASLR